MRCIVGSATVTSSFVPAPYDFGKAVPDQVPARLEVSTDELRAAFSAEFDEFVAECEREGEPDEPELRKLAEAGYPRFDRCVEEQPHLLGAILQEWLRLQLLLALCKGRDIASAEYWLNTVEKVAVEPGRAVVHGTALVA